MKCRKLELGSRLSTFVKRFVRPGGVAAVRDVQSADASLSTGSNTVYRGGSHLPREGQGYLAKLGAAFALFFSLLLGFSSQALADMYCSVEGVWDPASERYVLDGDVFAGILDTQIKVDADCEFRNWQPLDASNINYPQESPGPWLIVFNNVHFDGNLACSNVHEHKFWAVNSTGGAFEKCIDFLIPYEYIDKQSPAATAAVGVPFTYTLQLPTMFYPVDDFGQTGDPSNDDLHSVVIWDDLTTMGVNGTADLTYVSHTVTGLPNGVTYTFDDGGGKFLTFDFGASVIPAGSQITFEITVVLDDTANNVAGREFVNTAEWQFGRLLSHPDYPDDAVFYNPLPGAAGVSQLMTIVGPDFVVNKSSPATAINLTDLPTFTIDAQNTGGADAWETEITDNLPTGMCEFDPTSPTQTVSASVLAADGSTVRDLTLTNDYTVSFNTTTCQLKVTMTTAGGAIAPGQRLNITYQSRLNSTTPPIDGTDLTNVAGATRWSSSDGTYTPYTYTKTLSAWDTIDPTIIDHEDSQTVTAALSGYYFEKTVTNLETGADPATTATPGDRLRYKLRVFNVDETIAGITITDPLDLTYFEPAISNVTIEPAGAYSATWEFNDTTGEFKVYGAPLTVSQCYDTSKTPPEPIPDAVCELVIEFDIQLKSDIADGTPVANQAILTANGGGFVTQSDDPNDSYGVASPDVEDDPSTPGIDEGDEYPTIVTIETPSALEKTNDGQGTAKIGERFTYTITVPATPSTVPLYDVQIHDNLTGLGPDLEFVGATVLSGGTWTLTNSNSTIDPTNKNVIIEDAGAAGIDILPANGGQVEIAVTVEVKNSLINQDTLPVFTNSAYYTYNRVNGDSGTEVQGGGDSDEGKNIVEPLLDTAIKSWSYVGGKASSEPAEVGDIIEYTISVTNNGNSIAYDTNIVDLLPSTVQLDTTSATATFNGSPVGLFVANPAPLGGGAVAWGRENGDGSLDVPVGSTLLLKYKVTVLSVGVPIENSAYVDWTSLDGEHPDQERTGAGCPTVDTLNNYCVVPVPVIIPTTDTNAITKSVLSDTYAESPAVVPPAPPVVRVGDTVDYQLTVQLHEGITESVVVQDVLPPGMQLQGATAITSTGSIIYTSPTPTITPPASAGGSYTLEWNFGNIDNQSGTTNPDGTDLLDEIRIAYTAVVVTDPATGVAQADSILSPNAATLSYTGGDPTSTDPLVYNRLNATQTVDIRQPIMSTITKEDYVAGRTGIGSSTDPYQVDIINDTMKFRLQTCNTTGLAPAYNLVIQDTLPTQLDLSKLVGPVVKIGTGTDPATAVAATPVTEYAYTAPVDPDRLMEVAFTNARPIAPGECVFVEYDIGFTSNIAPNTPWYNSTTVKEYWSLPSTQPDRRQYQPTDTAAVYMTNAATLADPIKAIAQPVAPTTTVTIGEEVQYTITIPATNATLTNVVVTDILDPALTYVGATEANGLSLSVTTTPVATGTDVSITIASIPTGQQAVITLSAQVANIPAAPLATTDAGYTFTNTASYTYGGQTFTSLPTGQLTIVEPSVTVNKDVSPTTPAPTAGDTLHYTVDLDAAPAPASNAYDLVLVDTLSPGLTYKPTTANIGEPVLGVDPGTGGQTLTWSGLDITAGARVTVTYDVLVNNDVVIGQSLTNTATARWTSLDGDFTYERTGTGTAPDDYVASDTTTLVIGDDTTFVKVRVSDTYVDTDANVRIGDLVEYELRLGLQEGTHTDVVVTDTLPTGLQYVEMVSATYFGTVQPTPPAPGISGQTLTWDFSPTLVNPTDGDATNDVLVLRYRARVLNNVLTHSASLPPLTNNATLDYSVAGTPVTRPANANITVLQPVLSLNKTVTATGGDTVVDAGEVVTYTVDIQNTGTAPAYDVVLQDIIPAGMRAGGVTAINTYLVSSPQGAPGLSFDPAYDPDYLNNGVASWNFDDGSTPSAYTIPAGDTLRVIYSVTVDSDVGAGLTLTNVAQATHYYSLNNNDVSPTNSATSREEYASATASIDVTTPVAGALSKETTQPSAGIGEEFTYTITVPSLANPATTALHDVRIYDNLAVGGADLEFVRADVLPGSDWTGTLVGSVDAAGIVEIRNVDAGGIEIPAGGHLQVAVTVRLLNTATNNTAGLTFTNRAWYTYSNGITTLGTDPTTGATSGSMIVAHPAMTMTKTGPSPATMRVGTPATFTLDVQNTGTSDAWNVTVTDWLPNPTPGGMCDAGVSGVTATIYQADGTTTVQALVAGTHYNTSFTVSGTDPRCEFVLTTNGVAIAPTERLIVTYSVALDADNIDASTLTNIAGATQWLSADPAGGVYNTYTAALTDGSVGTVDHEDAYSVTVQGAVLTSQKTVENLTTGLSGANASPGDRLRYTIAIQNTTDIPLDNFSLVDELDRLNATPMFQAGSIANVSVPAGATFAISGNTLNVDGLNIAANGNLSISFEAVLVPVITSGTVVLNQGELSLGGTVFNLTDDPAIVNAQDPTETLISSAPQFQIYKTSADITGDPSVLVAGDTLRYTITVKNIGTEDAVNASLRDAIPVFTTYVANSTTLNGVAVADNAGASPLQSGMLINAPENTTPGYLRADASATTSNVATITFDVVTNLDVLDATVITNQAFLNGSGAGSGPFVERVSDDNLVNGADDPLVYGDEDPTRDIVGNLPWLDATKTASLLTDLNSNGAYDAGDTIRYTITVNNFGAIPATGVTLTDTIPGGTSYVGGTTRMNGVLVADSAANVSALESGMPINPAGSASGTVPAGASVEVTFDVQVASTVNPGDPIINQGYVASTELPTEPTDADGNDANEDQPTIVYVGSAQQLSIVKSVSVVGGGVAQPGGQLDYQVRVTNNGAANATNVVITDNLTALSGLVTYVTGSEKLNGVSNPSAVTYTAATQTLTANIGDLAVGESATLSFSVQIASGLADGTIIINNAQVDWNTPTLTATASARSDIGSIPGSATLGGNVWHDANFSNFYDPTEIYLAGWNVTLHRNNAQIGSATTDANGHYQFSGLATTVTAADQYELRFTAPGAGTTTAKLGLADSAFTNELQLIRNIDAVSGSNIQTLNLPIDPNGVVYDSVLRTPIAGATLTLLHGGTAVASSCFDDPAQQNQVTLASGFYKFDLNYTDPSCPVGGDYVISVAPPATGYVAGPSRIIPPVSNDPAIDATSTPYSVASCTADAVASPAGYCEAQPSEYAPPLSVAARTQGTNHYLYLTLSSPAPGNSQLFNNHIAVDPTLNEAITITKTAGLVNVSRGQLVPYTITVNNTLTVALLDLSIVDTFPAGFKYVKGSSRIDGQKVEPVTTNRTLSWNNLPLDSNVEHKIEMLFIVGSGVSEGEYVNRAQVFNTFTGGAASGEATATVRVVPDPTFDCTDIIGKVFDDKNFNGYQDEGELGLPNARVVSARGLIVTSDEHGRFHITCAVVPNESRGSNFILKLDDRSLPSGYRVTTENPRVQRVTRGKMMKFNFGATIHHVVRLDVAEGVFEPDSTTMRQQWQPRIGLLLEELKKAPSVLRLSYLADVEDRGLVNDRVAALKKIISEKWDEMNCCYKLTIESEVYWRRGAPPERSGAID